jgi:Arc/MetJ family transcription regulator
MSRTGTAVKAEILTFRIDASLKREVSRIARTERKPVGELLRELVQERVDRKRRLAFEAEARRQSLLLAAAAQDPNSDEAAVMRELDANFEEFAREWK